MVVGFTLNKMRFTRYKQNRLTKAETSSTKVAFPYYEMDDTDVGMYQHQFLLIIQIFANVSLMRLSYRQ